MGEPEYCPGMLPSVCHWKVTCTPLGEDAVATMMLTHLMAHTHHGGTLLLWPQSFSQAPIWICVKWHKPTEITACPDLPETHNGHLIPSDPVPPNEIEMKVTRQTNPSPECRPLGERLLQSVLSFSAHFHVGGEG